MTKLLLNIKMKLAIAACFILAASSSMAQLNGTYTINGSVATGGTNYQTWGDFATAITTSGVSGAVTVNVMNNETVTSAITLSAIASTSATNTVSINGNGYTLALSSAGTTQMVLNFTGADYVTVRNLTIENQRTVTNSWGVRFSGGSDYNTLRLCNIQFSGLTTGTTAAASGGAYVVFGASATDMSSGSATGTNGYFCTIDSCTMRTTNTNSPGPTYGICEIQNSGSYSSTASNTNITNNKIQNFFYMGIYQYYTNGTQILNNDISRANATSYNCNATILGMYSFYAYSTNRQIKTNGNNIHDLPYAGASSSSGANSTTYGIYAYYQYGTSTLRREIKNNIMQKWANNSTVYGTYLYYNYNIDITDNTIDKTSEYGTGYQYLFHCYYGQDVKANRNKVTNNNIGYFMYGFYFYYNTNSTLSSNEFNDNIIDNNQGIGSTYGYMYGVYFYNCCSANSTWMTMRNRITNNSTGTAPYGYIYGIYSYYYMSNTIASNIVARNQGQWGQFGVYFYTPTSGMYQTIKQNTVDMDQTGMNSNYPYTYAIYGGNYSGDLKIEGNIISNKNGYYGYMIYSYGSGGTEMVNRNTHYTTNMTAGIFWATASGASGSTWAGYAAGAGSEERFGDPKFVNPAAGNWQSNAFMNQNNVPTQANITTDINNSARNAFSSDRGAVESFCDMKIDNTYTGYTLGSPICGNTSANLSIKYQNLYPDSAYNVRVSYALNGGTKVSSVATTKIQSNGTVTWNFPTPVKFNKPGVNKLRLFVDMPDDNTTNDTVTYTITVNPTASGSSLSANATATKAIYQPTKGNDITIYNEAVNYDITNPTYPTTLNSGNYGSAWTVSVYAKSPGGITLTAPNVPTWTAPSGSTPGLLTWKPGNRQYEDSIITLWVKITNNANGCDSFLSRKVLQYGKIIPSFKFPAKICDGDPVLFNSTSYVKSGAIDYMWYFGTVNKDSSNAPSPVFVFPGPGTYNVKMVGKTLPYGFQSDTTITVTVNSIPKVGFTKTNACEGKALTFTNTTTPVNSAYSWDMGDATTPKTTKDVSYTYTNTGSYLVTLSASLNGCTAKSTQRVYQFDKPKANFTVAGNCDNLPFNFTNGTTIKSGLVGHYWNFSDNNNVSTDDDPIYMFSPVTTVTTKSVKLTATSEFGCVDTIRKTVTILPSPKVAYSFDKACSNSPTQFTNTTPTISGVTPSYAWDFGDASTSVQANPSKTWSSLGSRSVKLTVTLSNGCKAETMKNLTVLVQPKAQFVAADACANQPVVFDNQSTWASGDISYTWDFAGFAPTNTNSDPVITFANITSTTTINVQLKASIAGGCDDQITKQITINQLPKTCDFKATQDYSTNLKGFRFQPKDANGNIGGENGVVYTWIIENEGSGTSQGTGTAADFVKILQNPGDYKVTLRAKITATGCECEKSQTITVSSTKDLAKLGFSISPNPNKGNFSIFITEKYGKNVKVELLNSVGAVVKTFSATNGINSVDASELSAGVYVLRVSGANSASSQQIVIQK